MALPCPDLNEFNLNLIDLIDVFTESGLISVEQRGRERLYHLNYEKLLSVNPSWLRTFELNDDQI